VQSHSNPGRTSHEDEVHLARPIRSKSFWVGGVVLVCQTQAQGETEVYLTGRGKCAGSSFRHRKAPQRQRKVMQRIAPRSLAANRLSGLGCGEGFQPLLDAAAEVA